MSDCLLVKNNYRHSADIVIIYIPDAFAAKL